MKTTAKLLSVFVVLGIVAGLGYWLYLYLSDSENAPTFGDLWSETRSYFSRGFLIVKGQVTSTVGANDPISIAAGFIAREEGFSPKAYADPPGQTQTYSIGYGHQIVDGDGLDNDSHIDESQALDILASDLQKFSSCVNSSVTVDLSANQIAALISLCYNIGCGAFQKSTLVRLLNNGDFDGAQAQFAVWNKVNKVPNVALTARRERESILFGGDTTNA